MGLIILLIVVAIIWAAIKKAAVNTIDNAYANHQKKEEERRIDELNSNTNKLQSEWDRRIQELNIDLNKAVRVKYYTDYYRNKSTKAYRYLYLWPTEGAIGGIGTLQTYDENGNQVKFTSSPLTWQINYNELKDVRGVFLRNDVCLMQYDDTSLGFPASEYDKVKRVYEEAKAMTT